MTRILMLILKPESAWDDIAKARGGFGFALLGYLLPITLAASILEGLGLAAWRQWYVGGHGLIPISHKAAFAIEAMHLGATFAVIVLCAAMIWMSGDASRCRFNYRQTLVVMIYSLTPLFLFEPLCAIPFLNLWLPWAIGLFLSLRALYQGMPRMLNSVPGQALIQFFLSALALTVLACVEQVVFTLCLTSREMALNSAILHLAAKLPF